LFAEADEAGLGKVAPSLENFFGSLKNPLLGWWTGGQILKPFKEAKKFLEGHQKYNVTASKMLFLLLLMYALGTSH
jgi:hypothetical protein